MLSRFAKFFNSLLSFALIVLVFKKVSSQDYDVSEIQCTFKSQQHSPIVSIPNSSLSNRDLLTAKLKKPEGFKGAPIFADSRDIDPEQDLACQIRRNLDDINGLSYFLKVFDFHRCGVIKRNGFAHIRIWFPQFPGVVMQSDQELIIMCKPPEPTVIENKAAGFAGSFPSGARVSGIVEESPGKLEYEVALYKEATAPSLEKSDRNNLNQNSKELPVDQAVPIGTKLQLRAKINPESSWKYVKLMEVTVSPDPDNPHVHGSVTLVKEGCRNREFSTIIPHQPVKYRDRNNEVYLDFEAFLLSTTKERSTLWIHSQIKACMESIDCQPEFCLDLYEPSGHGKRRRRRNLLESNDNNQSLPITKFQDNIKYTVLMPGDVFHEPLTTVENKCNAYLAIAAILGFLLLVTIFLTISLAMKLHSAMFVNKKEQSLKSINELIMEKQFSRNNTLRRHFHNRSAAFYNHELLQ